MGSSLTFACIYKTLSDMNKFVLLKFVVLAIVVYLPSLASGATVHPVAVQCSPTGPVIYGTLEAELDISKWRPLYGCESRSDEGWGSLYFTPQFILSFNQLQYSLAGQTIQVVFGSKSCDFRKMLRVINFAIVEDASGYPLKTSTFDTVDGKLPSQFRFFGHSEACSVKLRD